MAKRYGGRHIDSGYRPIGSNPMTRPGLTQIVHCSTGNLVARFLRMGNQDGPWIVGLAVSGAGGSLGLSKSVDCRIGSARNHTSLPMYQTRALRNIPTIPKASPLQNRALAILERGPRGEDFLSRFTVSAPAGLLRAPHNADTYSHAKSARVPTRPACTRSGKGRASRLRTSARSAPSAGCG